MQAMRWAGQQRILLETPSLATFRHKSQTLVYLKMYVLLESLKDWFACCSNTLVSLSDIISVCIADFPVGSGGKDRTPDLL